MKLYISLLVSLAINQNAISCNCLRIKNLRDAQESSYEESDLVFTARVVSVGESMKYESEGWFNNKIFEVEVIENFKGTEVGQILDGHALTSCSGYPDSGFWLIYANLNEEGFLVFSTCGMSRAFHEPDLIYYDKYVPQPPTKEDLENVNLQIDLEIEWATIRLKAAKDLKDEILWLRSLQ